MLTFFRRLRNGLIGTDRASKYVLYAIGEIALVVIGILIALQINNWNEWRKERVKEKEVLTDLLINMESNVQQMETRLATMSEWQNSSLIIIDVIENRRPYHDSLGRHFHRSERGFGSADKLSYAGYEALKNVGFDIISNRSLKKGILNLFESSYTNLIDLDNQFDGNDVYHAEVLDRLFYKDRSGNSIPHDYSELFNDKSYFALITRLSRQRDRISDMTIGCLNETRQISQLIEKELNNDVR